MTKIKTAIMLCAGFGKRMGELTQNQPKPTIEIFGKSFIHRTFDMLIEHGVYHVIINAHYLADELFDHIQKYDRLDLLTVDFLYENEILETAGGVINALDLIRGDEFFIVNGDVLFTNYSILPFARLEQSYNKNNMDMILLLQPKEKVYGYHGKGDFDLVAPISKIGQLIRYEGAMPYVHSGVYLTRKSVFENFPKEYFKMMDLFKLREDKNNGIEKFYGVLNEGFCLHIGDKKSYYELDDFVKNNKIKL